MRFSAITRLFSKHPYIVLSSAILAYTIILSALSIIKYLNFGYNAMDLGIYNQVFWNSAHGNWFTFTIHPGNYLGDHFESFLLLLLPLYAFWQHPITLLVLQTIGLGLAAIPIYGIARQAALSHPWPLVLSFLYLVNPLTLNTNIYEFHILAFLPLVFFSAFYFYLRRNLRWFLIFLLLTLSIREDIAGIVFFFGAFIAVEILRKQSPNRLSALKQESRFIVPALLLPILWFLLAMTTTSAFGIQGSYKFGAYYAWLGSNWQEMILFPFIHPIIFFSHFFTSGTLSMTVGLLMTVLFLPIVAPRYLLLALTPFLEMVLTVDGGSSLIIYIHYAALFLPALIIGTIFVIKRLIEPDFPYLRLILKEPSLLLLILITAALYSFFALGPSRGGAQEVFSYFHNTEKKAAVEQMFRQISPNNTVVTSFPYLSQLSSRKNIYSLNYLYVGKTQYAVADFPVPENIDAALIDFDEIPTYFLQYHNKANFQDGWTKRSLNLEQILQELHPVAAFDNTFLFLRRSDAEAIDWFSGLKDDVLNSPAFNTTPLEAGKPTSIDAVKPQYITDNPTAVGPDFTLLSTEIHDVKKQNTALFLDFSLTWRAEKKPASDYFLHIQPQADKDDTQTPRIIPLAYGIKEPSSWEPGETHVMRYMLSFPQNTKSLRLSFFEIFDGGVSLSALKTMKNVYDKSIALEPSITISLK